MSIFETYSQSQKAASEELIYDRFPKELKIQCSHVWQEFFAQTGISREEFQNVQVGIAKIIFKEHALTGFPSTFHVSSLFNRINDYLFKLSDVNKALDVVQIVCFFMEHMEGHLASQGMYWALGYTGKAAIEDINARFMQHGIGYQYEQGKIIRLDKQLLHTEAVGKTFDLLRDPVYRNVNIEYLTAHDHFRYGRKADCVTWSLKAFESVMKVIAECNGWPYDKGAAAKALINVLFENEFFPPYMSTAMAGMRSFLESSMPTIRNKKGGHGSGSEVNEVPDSLAQYMLYITGSTINLIVEIQRERSVLSRVIF